MGVSPSVPPSHAADLLICSARSSSSRSLVSLACSAGWLKQSRFNELCAYDIILQYITYALSESVARFQKTEEGAGCAATPPQQVTSTVPAVSTASSGLFTFWIDRATNACPTACAHESATWSFVIPGEKSIFSHLPPVHPACPRLLVTLYVPFLSFCFSFGRCALSSCSQRTNTHQPLRDVTFCCEMMLVRNFCPCRKPYRKPYGKPSCHSCRCGQTWAVALQ